MWSATRTGSRRTSFCVLPIHLLLPPPRKGQPNSDPPIPRSAVLLLALSPGAEVPPRVAAGSLLHWQVILSSWPKMTMRHTMRHKYRRPPPLPMCRAKRRPTRGGVACVVSNAATSSARFRNAPRRLVFLDGKPGLRGKLLHVHAPPPERGEQIGLGRAAASPSKAPSRRPIFRLPDGRQPGSSRRRSSPWSSWPGSSPCCQPRQGLARSWSSRRTCGRSWSSSSSWSCRHFFASASCGAGCFAENRREDEAHCGGRRAVGCRRGQGLQ